MNPELSAGIAVVYSSSHVFGAAFAAKQRKKWEQRKTWEHNYMKKCCGETKNALHAASINLRYCPVLSSARALLLHLDPRTMYSIVHQYYSTARVPHCTVKSTVLYCMSSCDTYHHLHFFVISYRIKLSIT